MNYSAMIQNRKSVRAFTEKAIPYSMVQEIKTYYDTYDVIQVNGDRVVIGQGKTVTAAVHKDNLQRV